MKARMKRPRVSKATKPPPELGALDVHGAAGAMMEQVPMQPSPPVIVPYFQLAQLIALLVVASRHCPKRLQGEIRRAIAAGFSTVKTRRRS